MNAQAQTITEKKRTFHPWYVAVAVAVIVAMAVADVRSVPTNVSLLTIFLGALRYDDEKGLRERVSDCLARYALLGTMLVSLVGLFGGVSAIWYAVLAGISGLASGTMLVSESFSEKPHRDYQNALAVTTAVATVLCLVITVISV